MKDTPEIAAARIEAERARANMMATAQELQERVSPKTLARDAWEGAKIKGADLAEDAVDAVRARPVAVTGVVAAIALFLAREPLMDLAGKIVDGVSAKKPRRKSKKQTETRGKAKRYGGSRMIDNETNSATEDETMSARQRAIEAYENAGRRAKDGLSEAPFIALAGGIAAGALIAALLPRTQSEARLVRPTARRVKDTAKAAYKAARDTGEQQLNDLGLTRDKGEETIRSLFKGVTDAAKASAQSALDTARTKR